MWKMHLSRPMKETRNRTASPNEILAALSNKREHWVLGTLPFPVLLASALNPRGERRKKGSRPEGGSEKEEGEKKEELTTKDRCSPLQPVCVCSETEGQTVAKQSFLEGEERFLSLVLGWKFRCVCEGRRRGRWE